MSEQASVSSFHQTNPLDVSLLVTRLRMAHSCNEGCTLIAASARLAGHWYDITGSLATVYMLHEVYCFSVSTSASM